MPSLSADNRHIGRYIVQSADDRIYADYLQYRIGRISVSANFPNLDIVCTLLEKSPQLSRPLYTIINCLAFQGSSVECGLNTGCVKIFIDSEEMLMRKQREYGFEFSGQGRYSIVILDSYP